MKTNPAAVISCMVLLIILPSCSSKRISSSFAATPRSLPPGALYSTDAIIGNMRFVPSGRFIQGSPNEEPCRSELESQFIHCLTKNFIVMETEVTRQMWSDLMEVQSSLPEDQSRTYYYPHTDHPVHRITWYESLLFANLLSRQNGFSCCYFKDAAFTIPIDAENYMIGQSFCNFASNGYRLPSEGEWEYFCRAETTTPFSCDEPKYAATNCESCRHNPHPTLEKHCVYIASVQDASPHVVGSELPNPWDLDDVHGNVGEWCWDWLGPYPSSAQTDYAGPANGSFRVNRGGGWYDRAMDCRSAARSFYQPDYRGDDQGFRLVRTLP